MLLLIDNYDSFTYNIYQSFCVLYKDVLVVRNDALSIEDIFELHPSYIVLGPGPKTPKEAGICLDVIRHFQGKVPILGICLGHQAILSYFGMPLYQAREIVHGKVQPIKHNQRGIFRGVSEEVQVVRYHSLVGRKEDLPPCLEVVASSLDDEIMAIEHREFAIFGVQFHPESIGTSEGEKMLSNFLSYKRYNTPIKDFLGRLTNFKNLNYQECYDWMEEVLEGNVREAQVGAFLACMKMKGVEKEEILGFRDALYKRCLKFSSVKREDLGDCLDIVGTGGSGVKTFNVSSLSALALASMGVRTAKHGNRAVTSSCGSADIFELLGVDIQMKEEKLLECLKRFDFAFFYAPRFYSVLKNLSPIRKSLGFSSIFNLLGPLLNPLGCVYQVLGVYDRGFVRVMAECLRELGLVRALVVSAEDGYDELSLSAPTHMALLKEDGEIEYRVFTPKEIGLDFIPYSELKGGDKELNLSIARDVLKGEGGARLELLSLNIGAGLWVCKRAESLAIGYEMAREHLRSKKVLRFLEELQEFSRA